MPESDEDEVQRQHPASLTPSEAGQAGGAGFVSTVFGEEHSHEQFPEQRVWTIRKHPADDVGLPDHWIEHEHGWGLFCIKNCILIRSSGGISGVLATTPGAGLQGDTGGSGPRRSDFG